MYILLVEERIKSLIKAAPQAPGIYLFKNCKGEVIYVGKAKSLAARLSSYTLSVAGLLPKTARMVSEAVDLETYLTTSELEALLLEARMIRRYQPRYNSQSKDDKQPLYIKITSEEFPKVTTARRREVGKTKDIYFGPFPSSAAVRSVLKMLRRVFPFCSQTKIGRRACFYNHMGLCRPCPAEIVKYSGEQRVLLTKEYRKNIFSIKKILEGRVEKIIKELEREMKVAARREAFEEAAVIKRRIEQVGYVVQKPVAPEEFLLNPNLATEKAQEGVNSFWKLVEPYFKNARLPEIAEAYDISNTGGREAVGSQVTFFRGLPEKTRYKRYKIRMLQRPNDVGMMREVLLRRFKHKDWELPELVLVDGGKPQVAVAVEVLKNEGLAIPVVGLAKRKEEIIVPRDDGGFEQIVLKRTDSALHFVQRIRDEAHRFAQDYHHHLMRKRLKGID